MKNQAKNSNRYQKRQPLIMITGIIGVSVLMLTGISANNSLNGKPFTRNHDEITFLSGPGNGSSWTAPASANELKNPYKGNAAETAKGKTLYLQMCSVCHGNKGKGDGPAGVNLNPRPADHTSAKVQDQSDGAIFWKITNGKPPMAAYKDVLSEEQRWDLVNFIRTLK